MNDTSLSAADLLELHSLLRLFLNDSMNKVDLIPSKNLVHHRFDNSKRPTHVCLPQ